MKIKTFTLCAVVMLLGWSGALLAEEDVVSAVEKGCATEIETFCSQVMPGEGRMLACFYAHEDKLSGQCQYTLYDASVQLERAVSALNYLAGQCEDDMVAHCANVQLGEGRVVECLQSKGDAVSVACRQAMADVID